MADQVTRSQLARALRAGASGEDMEALLRTQQQFDMLRSVRAELGEVPELSRAEIDMPVPDDATEAQPLQDENAPAPDVVQPDAEDISPEEPAQDEILGLPQYQPRYLFGRRMEESEYGNQSPYNRGWWETARRALNTGWLDVGQRWGGLFDDSDEPPLSFEEQREQIGDRQVDIAPGLTQQELDRRIEWADRESYLSQFEGRWTAELLGSLPAYVLDPVTLVTLPFGGGAARTAMQSATAGGFLRGSMRAGAQVGAAGIGPELAVQQLSRGEIDGTVLAASTLAPVAFAPVMAAPGWAMRGTRNPQQAAVAAESPVTAAAPRNDLVTSDLSDLPNLPNPVRERLDFAPGRRDPVDGTVSPSRTPEQIRGDRLRQMDERLTQGYNGLAEGSTLAWARDFAAGAPAARQFAQERLNIDPDNPEIRAWVRAEAQRTARETAMSARDRAQVQRAVTNAERGLLSPDDRALLTRAGLMDGEGRLLPGVTRERVRDLDPNQVRRQAEGELRGRYSQALQEARGLRQELSDLSQGDLRRPQAIERLEAARQEVQAIDRQIADLNAQSRFIDDNVNIQALMNALDAARTESAPSIRQRLQEQPMPPTSRDTAVDARTLMPDDEDFRELMAQARRAGVTEEDLAAVQTRVGEAFERIQQCAVRT